MFLNVTITNYLLITTLVLLGLYSSGCQEEEAPFQWGGGGGGGSSSDDDDDTVGGTPDETWAVARVEVTRNDAQGTTSPVVRAVASWFPHQSLQMRPTPPNDIDSCHGGESPIGQYRLPDSTLDVGNVSLVMGDGEYQLTYEDDHFQAILPYSSWTPNQEFDIKTSGGPDLSATEFTGALGTPPSIAISSLVEAGGEVSIEWLGGAEMNQITILATHSEGDSFYWVSCRVQDDGAFTLTSDDLSVLPEGTALLDVRREVRADILVDELPGVVVGVSSATSGITVTAAGDDDDSAL